MFSYTLCKRIAADMFDAFMAGGEAAAQALFDTEMDYFDTFGDHRAQFTAHTMNYYRNLQA